MFEINNELNWKIREKRAKERKTVTKAATEIGITRTTLSQIESGKRSKVQRNVFIKITNWLLSGG